MCGREREPSVAGMNTFRSLRWLLIVGLGALALIRPVVNIVEDQLGVSGPPAMSLIITAVISVIWIAVVGLGRIAQPVLTLLFTGLVYAVFAAILSGILSPILTGELQGPFASPIAIIPLLLVNTVWGLAAGGLALVVQRLRGPRSVEAV